MAIDRELPEMHVPALLNHDFQQSYGAENTAVALHRENEVLRALLATALGKADVTLVFVLDASLIETAATLPNHIEFRVKLYDMVGPSMTGVARMLRARVNQLIFSIDDVEIDGSQIVVQLAIADGDTIQVRGRVDENELEENVRAGVSEGERSVVWE